MAYRTLSGNAEADPVEETGQRGIEFHSPCEAIGVQLDARGICGFEL